MGAENTHCRACVLCVESLSAVRGLWGMMLARWRYLNMVDGTLVDEFRACLDNGLRKTEAGLLEFTRFILCQSYCMVLKISWVSEP